MPRPAKAHLPRAMASAVPTARGTCSGCGQFRTIDGDVMAAHLTFVRDDSPRGGRHETCQGSGQPPYGRPVRAARLDRS